MKNFDFSEFQLNTLTIKRDNKTLDSYGDPVVSTSTAYTISVSLQPISETKQREYAQDQILADSIAYASSVLTLHNGDYATDDAGVLYDITGWENQGGVNPLGVVFAILLHRRVQA